MYLEGILGVLSVSAAIIAVKTVTSEYWAWRNRRDLQAKQILDALGDDGQKPSVYNQMYQYAGKTMLTQPGIYPPAGRTPLAGLYPVN